MYFDWSFIYGDKTQIDIKPGVEKKSYSLPVFLEVAGRIVSCCDKLYSAENRIQRCSDERTSH